MLAMLSCIFSKFDPIKPTILETENVQHLSPNHCQIAPGTYYPSEEVAKSLLELEISSEQIRRDSQKGIFIPHSGNSLASTSHSDPLAHFSISGTPISNLKSSRTSFERNESQTTSISTSPEQPRQAHRSNSNLASAFAASFSRPFSFNASASSSPPNIHSKKRLSPVGSYLANAPVGVTWGTTSFFGKSSHLTEDPKSAYSLSVSDAEEDMSIIQKPVFQVKLKNQDQFHNDGYAAVPLLNQSQEWQYRAYRESYAELLYVWNMPLARCALLKFNGDRPATSPPLDSSPSPRLNLGKFAIDEFPDSESLGLGLQTHCSTCFARLDQRNSLNKCSFCTSSPSPLICLFCFSLIQGLASPCLSCGHVLHLSCRSFLASLTTSMPELPGHETCISGCGCNCASHAVIEVEYPSRRKSSASMTIIGDVTSEQRSPEWKSTSPGEENLWEDVAYESLAKNLGARYLTPRPSQIWRGG